VKRKPQNEIAGVNDLGTVVLVVDIDPRVNDRYQVMLKSLEFAGSSGERIPLIMAWLEVRVLRGLPMASMG
jgi:hypothetical protein